MANDTGGEEVTAVQVVVLVCLGVVLVVLMGRVFDS